MWVMCMAREGDKPVGMVVGGGIGVLFIPVYAMKAYGKWSCSSSHSSTGYQMKKCQFHAFPMLPMEKVTW